MGFDITSAADIAPNQSVNTTSFDINSAKEVPELQSSTSSVEGVDKGYNDTGERVEENPISPVSGFMRGLLKFMGGGLEQLKEDSYTNQHIKDYPTQLQGETPESYDKRVQEFYQPRENQIIAGGAMKQLEDPMTMAMAVALPGMSATHLAQLGGFMALDNVRSTVQNILLPDASPTLKDVIDLGSFAGEAKIVDAASEGLSDFIHNSLLSQGKSPNVLIPPDILKNLHNFDAGIGEQFAEPQVTERPAPFVRMSQEGFPAQDIQTPTGVMSGGVLDRLGINQRHYDASINNDIPVMVPVDKLLSLSNYENFNEVKHVMTFDVKGFNQGEENASQGRESTEGGSVEEETNGEAQAGVHLRDDGQAEEASGEVDVPRETVTSKIAKSIEQKAVDARLTDKFDTLAGEEKVNVAEQSKLATDLVNNDLENARSIVRGDTPLPGKLRGTSLITAMEEHLKNNPDGDISHELANSPLVSATTRAAQELRLAAEREPDSFTAKMAELKKSLIDNAGGEEKIGQNRGKMVEEMKKETSKVNLSKDELKWEKFLDDIQC